MTKKKNKEQRDIPSGGKAGKEPEHDARTTDRIDALDLLDTTHRTLEAVGDEDEAMPTYLRRFNAKKAVAPEEKVAERLIYSRIFDTVEHERSTSQRRRRAPWGARGQAPRGGPRGCGQGTCVSDMQDAGDGARHRPRNKARKDKAAAGEKQEKQRRVWEPVQYRQHLGVDIDAATGYFHAPGVKLQRLARRAKLVQQHAPSSATPAGSPSGYGRKAVLNGKLEARAIWGPADEHRCITWKELKAIRLAVEFLLSHLVNRRVMLHEDNKAM
eukprot:jgi/Tetstr1/446731/TSEL_034219.t1